MMNRSTLYVGAMALALLVGYVPGAVGQLQGEQELVVSLEVQNKPMREVLGLISRQLDYQVTIDSDWLSYMVTGKYKSVPIDSFFRRVLKGENISVIFDNREKSIVVRSFGKKDFHAYTVSEAGGDSVDPISGMTLSELQEKKALEDELAQQQALDPDAVEPLSGLRMADIEANRLREDELAQQTALDPTVVDPISGNKRSDMEANRALEEEIANQQALDPERVDPLTGMKVSDIQKQREEEERLARQYSNDPDAIEPISGMRIQEIVTRQK